MHSLNFEGASRRAPGVMLAGQLTGHQLAGYKLEP